MDAIECAEEDAPLDDCWPSVEVTVEGKAVLDIVWEDTESVLVKTTVELVGLPADVNDDVESTAADVAPVDVIGAVVGETELGSWVVVAEGVVLVSRAVVCEMVVD